MFEGVWRSVAQHLDEREEWQLEKRDATAQRI